METQGIMKDVKETLLRDGKLKSMCEDNLNALRKCTTAEEAIQLYIRTIDWALENDYPSISILRENFSNCKPFGIYVDHEFNGETLSALQTYVLHNCKGVINVGWNWINATIPMIYVANGCDITFTCNESIYPAIRVPIYSTEDSRVKLDRTPNARFVVYKIKVKEG